jgi:hypothetical protein
MNKIVSYKLAEKAGWVIFNCVNCGSNVRAVLSKVTKGGKKFCSNKCKNAFRVKYNRQKSGYRDKKCLHCGIYFSKPKTRGWGIKKWSQTKFCSKTCQNLARSGNSSVLWKNGRHIDNAGYILLYSPNHSFKNAGKYVMEHRLVAEKVLKRYLTRKEVIHHIDGDKTNNNIDNLFLFSNTSEHIIFHKSPYPLTSNLSD